MQRSCPDGDRWVTKGMVAVYVDDTLASGESSHVREFLTAFRATFDCSDPEWVQAGRSTRFCGLEIVKEGDGFRLHQEAYARAVMAKHSVEKVGPYPWVEVPAEGQGSSRDYG